MEAILLIPALVIGAIVMFLPQIIIVLIIPIAGLYIWIYVLGKQTDRAREEYLKIWKM